MILDKTYRNHRTGQEIVKRVDKPDNFFLLGCASGLVIDAANHGDVIEEFISPNVITNYVKDQLGRMIFNNLMHMRSAATSQAAVGAISGYSNDSTSGGITFSSNTVPGEANLVRNQPSSNVLTNGQIETVWWPFQNVFLSAYTAAEAATEIWVPPTVVPITGSSKVCYQATGGAGPTNAECSISSDGNTFKFVWDYATTDFNTSFQSIHFASAASANASQFARTLLAAPVTKDNTQTLKLTYTFTYTP